MPRMLRLFRRSHCDDDDWVRCALASVSWWSLVFAPMITLPNADAAWIQPRTTTVSSAWTPPSPLFGCECRTHGLERISGLKGRLKCRHPTLLRWMMNDDSARQSLSFPDDRNSNHSGSRRSHRKPKDSRLPKNYPSGNSSGSGSSIVDEVALAVIPPDDAWDRIQRARHVANDVSYGQWPPAIRFFHPFCRFEQVHDTALEVARIIEAYQIAPFAITLSQWSIIPHAEAMESHFRNVVDDDDDRTSSTSTTTSSSSSSRNSAQQEEVRALIANEERIGKEKLMYRKLQQRKKDAQALREKGLEPPEEAEQNDDNRDDVTTTTTNDSGVASPFSKTASSTRSQNKSLEQRNAPYAEFNGPCVICLEPDEESKERLQAVRYLLKHTLKDADQYANLYSPSSSVSITPELSLSKRTKLSSAAASSRLRSRSQKLQRSRRRSNPPQRDGDIDYDDDDPSDFRPVVAIAAFATVSSAIGVARKLRKLWEPLTFNVTDLHLLSCRENSGLDGTSGGTSAGETDGLLQDYYGRYNGNGDGALSSTEKELRFGTELSGNQFGCDALVSFIGEEVEMDDELNQEMANMVFEKGEPGGYELRKNKNEDALVEGNKREKGAVGTSDWMGGEKVGLSSNLEKWLLEEDDEYDEGTVVVIGRTQFFTGEMRQYVGMPASSARDSRRPNAR